MGRLSESQPEGRRRSGKGGNVQPMPGFGSQRGRRSLGRPPEPAQLRSWRRPLIWGCVAVVLLAMGVVGWLVWPSGPDTSATRARQYRDVDACLLTGASGITQAEAAAVWSGLQEVSKQTAVRVSYLPVAGPATVKNARPFVATLVQRHCRAIVAVGAPEVSAAVAAAATTPTVAFVVVGSPAASSPNLVSLSPNTELSTAVAAAVRHAVSVA